MSASTNSGHHISRVIAGDAIDPEHHGLAVEHELLLLDLARRLDDPWIAVCPVIAATRVIKRTMSPSRSTRSRLT
jgi:hypothetical protein